MQSKKAIIIGSGVAGMAVATRLAVQGYKVSVYEKNSYPGGKLSAFEKDGYHFDAGPSLFTQPQNIEELFALAGEDLSRYFTYESIDVACKYFYENGKIIRAYTNREQFAEELKTQVNENVITVNRYLQRSEKVYNNIGTVFLNHSLHTKGTWLHKRIVSALSTVRPGYLFSSLHRHNAKKFSAPETVQLFDRFATYNGSDPYRAPAMLSLIPHLEQNLGTFYPKGGMISITNALYELAKAKGVQFYFNSPVQRIIHTEGKIKGVVINENNIMADQVVSNADVYFTYKNLLADQLVAKKLLRQERSSSALIFYWGISKVFPQLQLHNVFFSGNYKNEFENIFNKGRISSDPTVYLNITSKMEASHVPPGKENWFVMLNAPANNGQDWEQIKETARHIILQKLSRILGEDIGSFIETEHSLDPVMIEEQTASYMGSIYGTSSNSKLAAFLRHPNFTGNVEGLYFCGGSVHPGGGIPLCLKSAKIVADLVAEKDKRTKH